MTWKERIAVGAPILAAAEAVSQYVTKGSFNFPYIGEAAAAGALLAYATPYVVRSFRRPEINESNNPRAYRFLRQIDSDLDNETIKTLIEDGAVRNQYFFDVAGQRKNPLLAAQWIDAFNAANRWKYKRFNNRVLSGFWNDIYRMYKTIKEGSFDVDATIAKRYILGEDSDDKRENDKKEKTEKSKSEGKSALSRLGGLLTKPIDFYKPVA